MTDMKAIATATIQESMDSYYASAILKAIESNTIVLAETTREIARADAVEMRSVEGTWLGTIFPADDRDPFGDVEINDEALEDVIGF